MENWNGRNHPGIKFFISRKSSKILKKKYRKVINSHKNATSTHEKTMLDLLQDHVQP